MTRVGIEEVGSVCIVKLSFYPQSYWEPLKQGSNSSGFNIRQILLAGLG